MACLLTINILGDPLWCLFVLLILLAVSLFYNEAKLYCRASIKDQYLATENLVNELKIIDTKKIPFVIERFLQLDRMVAGLDDCETVCDSERCVVCLDEKAVIQTLPCQHRVMCGQCAWSVLKTALKQSTTHSCVVCRQEVRDFNGSLFKNLLNVKSENIRHILDETKAM